MGITNCQCNWFWQVALVLLLLPITALAKLDPDEVPTFQLRAKIVSVKGQPPKDQQFSFRFNVRGTQSAKTQGESWSDWIAFRRADVEQNLKGYPATYLKGYPVVIRLVVSGVVDPTVVNAELRFDETDRTIHLQGELYGPQLGILIWKDQKNWAHAATMADYNRRYWKALADVHFPAEHRPKKFPIVDRFIGGDNDRRAWGRRNPTTESGGV